MNPSHRSSATTEPREDIKRGTVRFPRRYQFPQQIGRGGMADVYRAIDTKLGREVAIKLMKRNSCLDSKRLRRFRREAFSASALNHPNIVTVYDIGKVKECRFIVMELVRGETLRQLLYRGALDRRAALRIAAQIVSALSAAHSIGIVHRDLKPENIMLSPQGAVTILDFGLAKLLPSHSSGQKSTDSQITLPGTIIGTAGYMSSEQRAGGLVDERSDLFSVGLILHEIVTATPMVALPLGGTWSPGGEPLTPLPRSRRALDSRLASIIERCFAVNPRDRFPSAEALSRSIALAERDHLFLGRLGARARSLWRWINSSSIIEG